MIIDTTALEIQLEDTREEIACLKRQIDELDAGPGGDNHAAVHNEYMELVSAVRNLEAQAEQISQAIAAAYGLS